MSKLDELKQIVKNARYFCHDFPPSSRQMKSRCSNCNKKIDWVCICGENEIPIICKQCYDVLKFAFEERLVQDVLRRDSSSTNSNTNERRSSIVDDIVDEIDLGIVSRGSSLQPFIKISSPKNVRHNEMLSFNPQEHMKEEALSE